MFLTIIIFLVFWFGLFIIFYAFSDVEGFSTVVTLPVAIFLAYKVNVDTSCAVGVQEQPKPKQEVVIINPDAKLNKKQVDLKPFQEDTIEKYREAVRGCEQAQLRFNTYTYMGGAFSPSQRADLDQLIDQCKGGK